MSRMQHAAILGVALLAGAGTAQATMFCVNSATELVNNLATAQANGVDDEVRIAADSYTLAAAPVYSANEAHAIDISGGWDAACNSPNAGTTTLNGQGLVRTLAVYQNSFSTAATIAVRDLTLVAGFTTGTDVLEVSGGALDIFDREGAVVVERVIMIGAKADQNGGGLHIFTSGPVLVRNNLAFGNTAAYVGGMRVDTSDPNLYVSGNTVVGNTATLDNYTGGLSISGSPQDSAWVSNNIVWNNKANGTAADLRISTSDVLLYNDIGVLSGTPDPLSQGNLSVDPQFAPCSGFLCFNFHLKRSSPLVDAGFNGPPGGVGFYDVERGVRSVGGRVDIGAYELDRIFANGFQ